MRLQQAEAAALPEICELYRRVCAVMQSRGNDQWRWGEYPSETILAESCAAGTLYVAREESGELLCAVTVDREQDPLWKQVNWLFGGTPGAFHRLAVAVDRQGRGLGRQTLNAVAELLRGMGCTCLRFDTYADNASARRLYEKAARPAGTFRSEARPGLFHAYEIPLREDTPLLPLRMHPAFRGGSLTPWGGMRLATEWGKQPPELPCGESLEVSAIPGLESRDDAGMPLTELIRRWGRPFAGRYGEGEPFPLLLKLIDARSDLSVQVHPDDEYAWAHEKKLGKNEAWLILETPPEGGSLVWGLKDGVTREDLRRACETGGPAIGALLRRVTVHPGDVVRIPAGCVHAIGGDILLYEIQQSSDITYRLYDWDRVDGLGNKRDLHISQALDVVDPSFRMELLHAPEDAACTRLLEEPYFTLDTLRVDGETAVPASRGFAILTALTDGLQVVPEGGEPLTAARGQTFYLPAAVTAVTLRGNGRAALAGLR